MNEAFTLDPEGLRAFVAVAECGGFTWAGERWHLSQSAVSQQGRRLEQRLGCPLLVRTTRQVALTEDGERMLGHARAILARMQQAGLHVSARQLVAQRLRLGVAEDMAATWLVPLLADFARLFPQVQITMAVGITRDLRDALAGGELDLVLGKRSLGETGGQVLCTGRLVWVGRVPESGAPAQRLVAFSAGCVYRAAMIEALNGAGQPWEVVCTSPSLAGVRVAVQAGLGVTALPDVFVRDLALRLADGGADRAAGVALPRLPQVAFAVFAPPHACTDAAQTLRDLVQQQAQARQWGGNGAAGALGR